MHRFLVISWFLLMLIVCLLTNILMNQYWSSTHKYISEGNPGLKLCTVELRGLFRFATAQTHIFYSKVHFRIRRMVKPWFLPLSLSWPTSSWVTLKLLGWKTTRFQKVCSMVHMSMSFVFLRRNMRQIYYVHVIISTQGSQHSLYYGERRVP